MAKRKVKKKKAPPRRTQSKPKSGARAKESPGFTQYKVHWDGVNFKLTVDGVEFYGWRRITSSPQDGKFWAVDIFAQRDGRHFAVKSVPYLEKDPMANQKSLDADLCAIANEWWYQRCQGNYDTLEDLIKRAQEPVLTFTSLATLDHAINELRRFRNEALSSGHQRYMGVKSDGPRDPKLTLRINMRKDAEAARKGKGKNIPAAPLPSPSTTVLDVHPGPRAAPTAEDTQDVMSLLTQLERTTEKAQGRRLRASLRKLGFRGGAKAIRAQLDAQAKAKAAATPSKTPKATRSGGARGGSRKGAKTTPRRSKPRKNTPRRRSK